MDLPDEGLVEHEETEASPGYEGAGPAIVRAVASLVDLVEVVRCSHSPLPEIVLEDVVAILELIWVSFCLGL